MRNFIWKACLAFMLWIITLSGCQGQCSSRPCRNSGICISSSFSLTGYYCFCTSGYFGNNCQYSRASNNVCTGTRSFSSTGYTGIITAGYSANAYCTYTITAPSGQIATFRLTSIDLETLGDECIDSLQVRDQYRERTFAVCGEVGRLTNPIVLTGGTRVMSLVLRSDGSIQGAGIVGTYSYTTYGNILCAGSHDMTAYFIRRSISTNRGTYAYVNNMRCTWRIRSGSYRTFVSVTAISLASGDRLTIQALTGGNSRSVTSPGTFNSQPGVGLLVQFTSDRRLTGTGVRFQFWKQS